MLKNGGKFTPVPMSYKIMAYIVQYLNFNKKITILLLEKKVSFEFHNLSNYFVRHNKS